MVPANRKIEALQAMTLVEYSATLTTMGVFGFIFSSFADIGKSYLTFYCNAVRSYPNPLFLTLHPLTQ
jgi:hypothetical protein